MELHQKINRLIWKRMEQQCKETPDETSGREKLLRVIEKVRYTPIQNNTKEQWTSKNTLSEETYDHSKEITSTNSNDSIVVPAINFNKPGPAQVGAISKAQK